MKKSQGINRFISIACASISLLLPLGKALAGNDLYTLSYHAIAFSPAGKISNIHTEGSLRASWENNASTLVIYCSHPSYEKGAVKCKGWGKVNFVFSSKSGVPCLITINDKNGIHSPAVESSDCAYAFAERDSGELSGKRGIDYISEFSITESRFLRSNDISSY